MSANASAGSTGGVVLESDIFQRFESVCGTCHGPAVDPPGQGGFQIQTADAFATAMTPAVLAHVQNAVCPERRIQRTQTTRCPRAAARTD